MPDREPASTGGGGCPRCTGAGRHVSGVGGSVSRFSQHGPVLYGESHSFSAAPDPFIGEPCVCQYQAHMEQCLAFL